MVCTRLYSLFLLGVYLSIPYKFRNKKLYAILIRQDHLIEKSLTGGLVLVHQILSYEC